MFLGREAFFSIFLSECLTRTVGQDVLGRRKGKNLGWGKVGMRGGYCKDHTDRDSVSDIWV